MSLTLVVALVLALAFGLWRGGSLKNLSETRVRWPILLFEGLLIQLVFDIWNPEGLSNNGALSVLVLSNVAVASFLFLNRLIPGMVVIGLGLVLNTVVISANQAMPVSASASETAGIDPPPKISDDLKHELLDSDTRLGWLGDVIPVPVLGEVLSAGDIVLALGVARLVYAQTKSPRKATRPSEASG